MTFVTPFPWPYTAVYVAINVYLWYGTPIFRGQKRAILKKTVGILISLVGFVLFNVVTTTLTSIVMFFGEPWMKQHPRYALQISVVVFAGLIGFGAHHFKRMSKTLYGVCEVLFAVLYAMSNANRIDPAKPDQQFVWVAILGSAYIVARGLNNISEAVEERHRRKVTR